jgi:two-component system CheB/CheR fusion protein
MPGKRRQPSPTPAARHGLRVVGIGASAGGLEACRHLVEALAPGAGIGFILVQHLDPAQESLLVDLLTSHTKLTVVEAADGMLVQPDQVAVIPPGSYLSVSGGRLRLSKPGVRHGARMPFDFLLRSLAEEYGARAGCIVLSGTGADGSLGLAAIHAHGGLVIAQEPSEAAYPGMPDSAIQTGCVDQVLPVGKMQAALVAHVPRDAADEPAAAEGGSLATIVDLLRSKTAHDFTEYKQGTLQRRIERRMTAAQIGIEDFGRYAAMLLQDPGELDLLASDCLINVTNFFRDPAVFHYLATEILPGLVARLLPDRTLRIWVAGCSTGEETYSLAMLCREAIAAAHCQVKLQVFASDVDPGAVAQAREGVYPASIVTDVSAARLERFFCREEDGYRVLPELRGAVVFTVQDVLSDPPFSRLDLVSCRNLLIYLRPEAQARVISLLHFALRDRGVLLLGGAETIADTAGRFEVISKPERLFRRIGRSRPGDLGFLAGAIDGGRGLARAGPAAGISRQAALAEVCRRQVLETYAPAAILIDAKNACLYSLGPTEAYLRVPPGHPTHDLLSMTRPDVRARLASAIRQAGASDARVVITGIGSGRKPQGPVYSIAVQPVRLEAEQLMLICFLDDPRLLMTEQAQSRARSAPKASDTQSANLEAELEATRVELQGAIHSLEMSAEEQKAINEEALSVNEEYQSTNEELLTSKEELQSLNEELTALNAQLQETLERQRTTANDLENVLNSTDVATLFLDSGLRIRFFTPATRALFKFIPADVGRPLSDLASLAADTELLRDARAMLTAPAVVEREIETEGTWYLRRMMPYRTHDQAVEGVVITFMDITERHLQAAALDVARHDAEQANLAKTRFLAMASHDLRQPLQTLALIQGLLARRVEGGEAARLVALLDPTLGAMSGMLNTLLDINQIDAGTTPVKLEDFSVAAMMGQLRDEFIYLAQAKGLKLRVVACDVHIRSDPRLLEQMVRNLLSNALKYTFEGGILLGCRRRGAMVLIEVWDTGIGIAEDQLQAIFREYHQIDNAARERSKGLGLGLAIVQRLSKLLGHEVRVRSRQGHGSVFGIVVARVAADALATDGAEKKAPAVADGPIPAAMRQAMVLVVEDDQEERELLELVLTGVGHRVVTAPDADAAARLVAKGTLRPDLILADFNLPGEMNGLALATLLRARLRRQVPVIILTGDISTGTLRDIADADCMRISKPVRPAELTDAIQKMLPPPDTAHPGPQDKDGQDGAVPVIFVVDDDSHIREGLRRQLEDDGHTVRDYASCEDFLDSYRPGSGGCLLVDAYLPGMHGIDLLRQLRERGDTMPAIMITGDSDVGTAVQALKAGAVDFIEKPVGAAELRISVARALDQSRDGSQRAAWHKEAVGHLAGLTARQREVMAMVLAGHPSKNIAADLGISQRTVENHRASIMAKTGARSLPALARIGVAAEG